MTDHIYSVIETIGTSKTTVEEAIQNGIKTAAKTVGNLESGSSRTEIAVPRWCRPNALAKAQEGRGIWQDIASAASSARSLRRWAGSMRSSSPRALASMRRKSAPGSALQQLGRA
jgi:hypothetical protein